MSEETVQLEFDFGEDKSHLRVVPFQRRINKHLAEELMNLAATAAAGEIDGIIGMSFYGGHVSGEFFLAEPNNLLSIMGGCEVLKARALAFWQAAQDVMADDEGEE